jgi:hypothetical protein
MPILLLVLLAAGCAPECPWNDLARPDDRALDEDATGVVETTDADGWDDVYLYDADGEMKVGVRADWGAAIVFFGPAGAEPGVNDGNVVDANDTGREVQVALYDPDRAMQGCAWNASCATTPSECPASIRYLGWNPVQGGNRCGNGSGVEAVGDRDGTLESTTLPLHWNPDWDSPDCDGNGCTDDDLAWKRSDVDLVQRLRFVRPNVLELRYTVTGTAHVEHAAAFQEMPTVYAANGNGGPDLWRLFLSDGAEVPIDTPSGNDDGFNFEIVASPAGWVTLQDDDVAHGVGILNETGLILFQAWQLRSLPFNNVRALASFGIPASGSVNARSYLLYGSFEEIASEADSIIAALAPFGGLEEPGDRSEVGETVVISGWALDNRAVESVAVRVDEGDEVALAYGEDSPDIALAWPGYTDASRAGFSGTVDLASLDDDSGCLHVLEIVATDTDGNERIVDRVQVRVAE